MGFYGISVFMTFNCILIEKEFIPTFIVISLCRNVGNLVTIVRAKNRNFSYEK